MMFQVLSIDLKIEAECATYSGARRVFDAMIQRGQAPAGIVESHAPLGWRAARVADLLARSG